MEDLREFLESGLLEAYAAGQATAEERDLVEKMTARHPEAKAELDSIELAIENFARAVAVPPPPGLKQHILQAIEQEASKKSAPQIPEFRVSGGRTRLFQWLGAALFAGVAVLVWQFGRIQNENTALKNSQLQLERQLTDCNARSEQTQKIYAFLRAPQTHSVELQNETSLVRAHHNAATGEVGFDLSALAPAPDRSFYQLWAIVDGVPVSLGMAQRDAPQAWQSVSFSGKAAAFAVSLEDKPGGNAQPTQVLMVKNTGS
jgi:Anti-sigma-K factor rskA